MARSNKDFYTTIYDLDYFDASQMFLYIGDVWVDEVTSLQYQTQQNKTPIYGYASQLWDDCAAGQVIVQGSFTINFKEQGYLWAVLRRWHNISTEAAFAGAEGIKNLSRKNKALRSPGAKTANDRRPVWGSNVTRIERQNIERLVQGDFSRGDKYKFYQQLAGYSTFDVKSPRDKIFEDIVEDFEDQIWQDGVGNTDLNNQVRRTDDNIFDGFDIFVVFGNYANKRANHTVQKIMDVRLLTQGKTIAVGNGPIQEEYSFIARSTA